LHGRTAWPINDGWRFSPGDNPAWAEPDYNDSVWTVVSLSSAKPRAPAGLRWYRIHLRLPAGRPPAALLLTIGKNAFQVFVNGRPANDAKVLSTFRYHYPLPQLVPLPDGVTDVVIVVRCGEARYEHEVMAGDAFRSAAIGSLFVVERAAEVADSRVILTLISSMTINLALCLGGPATLGLFWAERRRREYLWLGAYLLALGLADMLWCLSQKWLPFSVKALGGDPLDWLYPLLQIEFTFVFAGEPLGRSWQIYQGVLAAGFLSGSFFNWFGWFPNAYGMVESLVRPPTAIGLPVLLVMWLRRGNREAGWLILPSILPIFANSLFNIAYLFRLGSNSHRLDFLSPILSVKIGLVGYRVVALGDLLFLIAVVMVIFLRHTRLTQVQERSAAKLNAAREMQRRLVPAELPQARGCILEASYRPAAEVGGDFYHAFCRNPTARPSSCSAM
jgi:phosphoserine phosphatase RsbU/P